VAEEAPHFGVFAGVFVERWEKRERVIKGGATSSIDKEQTHTNNKFLLKLLLKM
jgi:hypothetical protein